MKIISKFTNALCNLAKALCALLLAVMLVVSLIEIIRRYALGHSFPWADELIRYCIVGVASLGGTAAYHEKGGLVSFDLVETHSYGTFRLILELVINTIVLGLALFMVKNSVATIQTPSIQRQISIGLGISMMWAYLPIVIGMVILVILALEKYLVIFQEYKKGAYKKPVKAIEEGGEQG